MLGWEIFISVESPEQSEAKELTLAYWLTGMNGIHWIEDLVKEGKAEDAGGNGYPCTFFSTARVILPLILRGLPKHEGPEIIGEDYIMPKNWSGTAKLNKSRILACSPDERLKIEAWDQS